jgi:hypothetical protein
LSRPTEIRLAVGVLALACALGVTAGPAGAHQPVFVTEADPDPARGPLLEDGSLSFAVYGVVGAPGDTRGVRTRLRVGDPLVVDLLVPARSPEQDLGLERLPFVVLRAPDGTERRLLPDRRIRFDEPYSRTSYDRIVDLRETAPTDGLYEITVVSRGPARFTLATGVTEGVRGAVTDAEVPPPGGIAAWYATPPPEAVTPAPTTATTRPAATRGKGKGKGKGTGKKTQKPGTTAAR